MRRQFVLRMIAALTLPLVLMAQRQAGSPGAAPQRAPTAKAALKPAASVNPPVIKVPPVSSFALQNGMLVWLAPNNELPSVSGRLVFPAGSLYDPEGRTGVANAVAELLIAGGSRDKSPAETRRFLADRAAEAVSHANAESATVRFWSLADHAAEVVEFLAANVATPAFERLIFTTAKEQLRQQVQRRNEVPAEVASRAFTAGAFGAAAGATMELGELSRIQREDLFDFHLRAYRPEGAQMVVSGDFEPAAMRALLERTFGAWKPAPAPPLAKRAVVPTTSATVWAAAIPNATTSAIEVGYPLDSLSVEEFAALNLLTQILSRRLEPLRNPRAGETQSVDFLNAQLRAYDGPPSFRVVGQARVRETVEALRDVMAAFDAIRDGGMTAGELSAAKARTLQIFQSEFSRPQAVLELYGTAPKAWGAPADFLPKLGAKLASASLEECLQAAKKAFAANRRVVVTAAETNDFRTSLDVLKIPVNAVNTTIAPAPPEGPATPDQLTRGAEKWRRMRTALGIDRTPVRDAEFQLKGAVFGAQAENVEQTIRWLAPGILRTEQRGLRSNVAYFDGSTSWYFDGFRTGPFSAAGVRIYRGEVFRFPYWLAARNLAPPLIVQDIGSGVIRVTDGTESTEIALNDKTGLPEIVWYIDPANGQKAEERMFDYKSFDGIPYWSRLEMYRGGFLVGELNTVSARFNTGLTAAQLERRPEPK